MLDHRHAVQAGLDGVLFSLAPKTPSGISQPTKNAAPKVGVALDYSSFAEAFGGDYGNRLHLVSLPTCVLDRPGRKACRKATPVPAVNDAEKQTLSATSVTLKPRTATVLAATADTQSDKGDYKATTLAPSSSWSTDLNAGSYSWSYDMPVPDVPGGLEPTVSLSYSSGAVDGRTGNSNNQASWVGDGFDLWPGYIERRYKPCAEDGEKSDDGNTPGDQCWAYDNAYLSFNGKAGELVPDNDAKDTYRLKDDDGTVLKRLTSADRDNGDNDNEYWELIDPSGTRYYFGYNKLPGWTSGKDTTDSTWTVPVYGNNTGEPCHASTFADSWCQQAWRWNLDYVVDPHGNAVTYSYAKETNYYGRDLTAEDGTAYTRGGYLRHIDYGLTSDDLFPTNPPAEVVFDSTERCLPETGVTCDADTIDSKSFYWYDTPWDMNCPKDSKCDQGRLSPTFWTRKRLTSVTTEVLKGTTLTPVDSWALQQRWGTADVDYQLELSSIQHTGHTATTPLTLPPTTFAYTQLANRLDKTGDGYAPFIKDRLSTIDDEYGGEVDVNYSDPTCTFTTTPTPETNTTRCFPEYIGGSPTDDPDLQWFNKYVVNTVTTSDRTGGAPDQVTRYDYLGDAAWHYDDDDGLTKEKFKTWSQWRGYQHVRVETGGQGTAPGTMKTQEDDYFLRGMDGDRKTTSGGTKTVSVTLDSGEGAAITDADPLAGYQYKTLAFSAPSGKVLTKTVNHPWYHETAKKVRDWGTLTANFNDIGTTRTWTSLDDGAGQKWRTTTKTTTYDTVAGRPTEVDDLGDDATPDDDQCTRTTYATNTSNLNATDTTLHLFTLPSRVETVAKNCDTSPDRAKDVLSDVRTAYDKNTYGQAPTKGDATAVANLKSNDGTTATYLEAGSTFDHYGRTLTTTDLTATVTAIGDSAPTRTPRTDGRTTTTTYSPTTGIPTASTVTTPPATPGDSSTAQTTTTTLDPLRGLNTKTTDTNGKATTLLYDALGRPQAVWLPDRPTSNLPTYQYNYYVQDGHPTAVATRTLNPAGGTQTTPSYTLFDGYLRPRQTQAPGPDGGRLVTDTFYDERGLVTETFDAYYTAGTPDREIFPPKDAVAVDSQHWNSYDGLGREIETQHVKGSGTGGADQQLGTTTTIYGGDRTTVIPPQGGTATTTLTDARGNTTELRQLHARDADAAYDTTHYSYTPAGKLATITDPAGNAWRYTYDQRGNQTQAVDPDSGTTTATFDDRNQQTTTTTPVNGGTTLATVYDGLGRKTELHDNSATGTLRASWTYDTVTGAKGQLASSTRYVDGQPYTQKIDTYNRLYQPTKTATVIPASEGALAGTYENSTTYWTNGLTKGRSFAQMGSIQGGGWTYNYDDNTLRNTAVYGDHIRADATYNHLGQPLTYKVTGSVTQTTDILNTYQDGTERLSSTTMDRPAAPGVDKSATYGYDEAGDVTSLSDVSRTGTDTQCFQYDHLQRLTEAWSQAQTTCADKPSDATIAGPAPYWQSYTYDLIGDRTSATLHATNGDATQDTKQTYHYPTPGSKQPHTLTTLDTTSPTETSQNAYGYDDAGNTTSRIIGGDEQSLNWDAEGHLAKVTQPDGNGTTRTTQYLYDADGNRLISRTSKATTLYLASTEITLDKDTTTPKATRYIPLASGIQAVLADDGTYTVTYADQQNTGQLAITATATNPTQRRTLPFGGIRGNAPTDWPGSQGFVGGTDDSDDTGLTHLGVREYDPTTGRFLSVDPVLASTDIQSLNGYAYSDDNPVTLSDPNGQRPLGACDGPCHDGSSESWSGGPGGGWHYTIVTKPKHHKTTVEHVDFGHRGRAWARTAKIPSPRKMGSMGDWVAGVGVDSVRLVNWFANTVSIGCWGQDCGNHVGDFAEKLASKLGADTDSIRFHLGGAAGREVTGLAILGTIGKLAEEDPEGFAAGCYNSFPAGTKVLLADGSTKAINKLKVGDVVASEDPRSGKHGKRQVDATHLTPDDVDFATLTLAGAKAPLVATDHHPFWSPSKHAWVEAGSLKAGMTLHSTHGRTVQVDAVAHFHKLQRAWNLTVRDLHTYYVVAAESPVLVHNGTGLCGGWRSEFDDLPKGRQGHVREMPDEQNMRDTFERWTAGAERLPARGPKIPEVYRLEDGTVMQWRTASGSGGATIDIKPGSGGKPLKVHLP